MARSNAVTLVLLLLAVIGFGAVLASPLGEQRLVGANQCTWGPSFWCHNLTNAKGCSAVTHCIQTVWERQEVPEDNDSICQICKDMVKQARDQLRSNETMEELKEVFEGSCNLIPIKVVKKECSKLADDFIPELVEALSSQMNPDQVCSVAGLCNNAEIDKLLMSYYTLALEGKLQEEPASEELQAAVQATQPQSGTKLSCGSCNHVSKLIVDKFAVADRDEVLEKILHLCGEMSSFSDACSNIVLMYFNEMYDHVKTNLESGGMCHLSGVCAYKYHQHPEDTATKEDELATLAAVNGGDDIPCELCQQLVQHLRDVLIANTTEAEFKQVLEGLCKQTKGFKDECLSIADQYYDVIYKALVNQLDANGACFLIGVCPKGKLSRFDGEIRPLLPALPPAEIKITIRKKLGANEPKITEDELHGMALPIDHLMGAANPGLLVEGGKWCTICEYMLHFIQETLATPATEDEIKDAVSKVCDKTPDSIRQQCHNFIDMYGDAVIALLIQGLNPREVCPKMQMCPANHEYHDDMEVFSPTSTDSSDKPTCPLCLFAVEQAQEQIKGDKSKQNIKEVLDHLCVRLPTKLRTECTDFVDTYSGELIDLLITDFKPQEICVAIKLCEKTTSSLEDMGISLDSSVESTEEDFELNEIGDSDEMPVEIAFGQHVDDTPNCLLCKELIKIAEKKMDKHKSRDEIKQALEHSCEKLRKPLQHKCHDFVEKYGDKIADLVIKEMTPEMICREVGLCLWSAKEVDFRTKFDASFESSEEEEFLPECAICKELMKLAEKKIKKNKSAEEIKRALQHICDTLPRGARHGCHKIVEKHGNEIVNFLIKNVATSKICHSIGLCMMQPIEDEDLEIDEALKYDVIVLPSYARVHLMTSDQLTVEETPNCVLCEFIMTKLETELKDKATQEKIKHTIEHICEHLPNTIKKKCDSFVVQYANAILALIGSVKPNEICRAMYMCTKPKLEASLDAFVNEDVAECGVCHGATVALMPFFHQHLDHSDIGAQEMIEVACENVPGKYYGRCSEMIRIYGHSILHLSQKDYMDDEHICAAIGKCFENESSNLAFAKISA